MSQYKHEGKGKLPHFQLNEKLNNPEFYVPSQALVDAVNVALMLGQPLLLTGEPGTGKTQLAFHVAHFYDLGNPLIFNVQTTATATDLFYKYDALGHFQYNQTSKQPLTIDEIEAKFIHYNALGEAIRLKKRCVVLIDEIDKAPRDFPNDILYALESLSFRVPEINKTFVSEPEFRPVIIMTSNSEKNLPDAFMRRVVYFNIPFPTPKELLYILSRKTENIALTDLDRLVAHFNKIRGLKFKKPPSTAELIYWALLLQKVDFPIAKLDQPLDNAARVLLMTSYSVLAKNKEDFELLNQL
jgi:MoxR-like ATPase